MRKSKSYIVGFLADLVLTFSTETDVFMKQTMKLFNR